MELDNSEFSNSFTYDLKILLNSDIDSQILHYQKKLKKIMDQAKIDNKEIIINVWRVDK